ncbi:MAG TPA: hypothetical protein VFQ61_31460 [Polyangiaceae bacterium]|nr:hypothetical protein [Polyangiaceae bacterium]
MPRQILETNWLELPCEPDLVVRRLGENAVAFMALRIASSELAEDSTDWACAQRSEGSLQLELTGNSFWLRGAT